MAPTCDPGKIPDEWGDATSHPGDPTCDPGEITDDSGETTDRAGVPTSHAGEATGYPGEVPAHPAEATSNPGTNTALFFGGYIELKLKCGREPRILDKRARTPRLSRALREIGLRAP